MSADKYPGLRVGDASPWDRIDYVRRISDGIWSCGTAGHGGIWVAPELHKTMPPALRDTNVYGGGSWYEEDCEWALVALAFGGSFKIEALRAAVLTIQHFEKGGPYKAAALWLAHTPDGLLVRLACAEKQPTESATNPAFLTIN